MYSFLTKQGFRKFQKKGWDFRRANKQKRMTMDNLAHKHLLVAIFVVVGTRAQMPEVPMSQEEIGKIIKLISEFPVLIFLL